MGNRVSLTDVARHAGVTAPTVSRALRGLGNMPTATRARIQEAARTLGYFPNPLLAALASKRFGSGKSNGTPIAYIHYPETSYAMELLAQKLIGSLQEHGRKLGYFLEKFNVDDFRDGAHATQVLFSRGVQGIIVSHLFELKMLPGMDWDRFSVVGFGESRRGWPDSSQPLLYRAAVDHFGSILQAWTETWKRGYRRIGFAVFPTEAEVDDQLRWSAMELCGKRLPAHLRISPLVLQHRSLKGNDRRKVRTWVQRHRPEAIIGFNSYLMWVLEKEGLRVPEDIGFVTLHKELGVESPGDDRASGMKQMRLRSLIAALELLDQQIRYHQYGLPREPRVLMIQPEWIEGETLPFKVPSNPDDILPLPPEMGKF